MTDKKVEIDPIYLKEVMERCKAECPDIADNEYIVWVNSVDYILREMGINDGEEDAKIAYAKAQEEFKKKEYFFTVVQPSDEPEGAKEPEENQKELLDVLPEVI